MHLVAKLASAEPVSASALLHRTTAAVPAAKWAAISLTAEVTVVSPDLKIACGVQHTWQSQGCNMEFTLRFQVLFLLLATS